MKDQSGFVLENVCNETKSKRLLQFPPVLRSVPLRGAMLREAERGRWGLWFLLLWLEISVNYAQVVQMVEGQGQLCKVEFHIFLCKHNLIRTGQIYSLNSEEKFSSSKGNKKTKQKKPWILSFSYQNREKEYYRYCHNNINISNTFQDSASCWSDAAGSYRFSSETCFQQ